ncbi:MAG: uncharacterized protein KVP18_001323 [Porospora cf. gigantea A]|uniref:uncharacterized protein n=1 Tax=Porospora cf. gigantea A TaxID=2853593 RepID=UPI00355975EE|nr:MAG: hypothetical protein KVP18_001323 [Porospora cf. gigantea A]
MATWIAERPVAQRSEAEVRDFFSKVRASEQTSEIVATVARHWFGQKQHARNYNIAELMVLAEVLELLPSSHATLLDYLCIGLILDSFVLGLEMTAGAEEHLECIQRCLQAMIRIQARQVSLQLPIHQLRTTTGRAVSVVVERCTRKRESDEAMAPEQKRMESQLQRIGCNFLELFHTELVWCLGDQRVKTAQVLLQPEFFALILAFYGRTDEHPVFRRLASVVFETRSARASDVSQVLPFVTGLTHHTFTEQFVAFVVDPLTTSQPSARLFSPVVEAFANIFSPEFSSPLTPHDLQVGALRFLHHLEDSAFQIISTHSASVLQGRETDVLERLPEILRLEQATGMSYRAAIHIIFLSLLEMVTSDPFLGTLHKLNLWNLVLKWSVVDRDPTSVQFRLLSRFADQVSSQLCVTTKQTKELLWAGIVTVVELQPACAQKLLTLVVQELAVSPSDAGLACLASVITTLGRLNAQDSLFGVLAQLSDAVVLAPPVVAAFCELASQGSPSQAARVVQHCALWASATHGDGPLCVLSHLISELVVNDTSVSAFQLLLEPLTQITKGLKPSRSTAMLTLCWLELHEEIHQLDHAELPSLAPLEKMLRKLGDEDADLKMGLALAILQASCRRLQPVSETVVAALKANAAKIPSELVNNFGLIVDSVPSSKNLGWLVKTGVSFAMANPSRRGHALDCMLSRPSAADKVWLRLLTAGEDIAQLLARVSGTRVLRNLSEETLQATLEWIGELEDGVAALKLLRGVLNDSRVIPLAVKSRRMLCKRVVVSGADSLDLLFVMDADPRLAAAVVKRVGCLQGTELSLESEEGAELLSELLAKKGVTGAGSSVLAKITWNPDQLPLIDSEMKLRVVLRVLALQPTDLQTLKILKRSLKAWCSLECARLYCVLLDSRDASLAARVMVRAMRQHCAELVLRPNDTLTLTLNPKFPPDAATAVFATEAAYLTSLFQHANGGDCLTDVLADLWLLTEVLSHYDAIRALLKPLFSQECDDAIVEPIMSLLRVAFRVSAERRRDLAPCEADAYASTLLCTLTVSATRLLYNVARSAVVSANGSTRGTSVGRRTSALLVAAAADALEVFETQSQGGTSVSGFLCVASLELCKSAVMATIRLGIEVESPSASQAVESLWSSQLPRLCAVFRRVLQCALTAPTASCGLTAVGLANRIMWSLLSDFRSTSVSSQFASVAVVSVIQKTLYMKSHRGNNQTITPPPLDPRWAPMTLKSDSETWEEVLKVFRGNWAALIRVLRRDRAVFQATFANCRADQRVELSRLTEEYLRTRKRTLPNFENETNKRIKPDLSHIMC